MRSDDDATLTDEEYDAYFALLSDDERALETRRVNLEVEYWKGTYENNRTYADSLREHLRVYDESDQSYEARLLLYQWTAVAKRDFVIRQAELDEMKEAWEQEVAL